MGRGEQISPAGPQPAPGRQTAGLPQDLHSSGSGSSLFHLLAPMGGLGVVTDTLEAGISLKADRRAYFDPAALGPFLLQHLSLPPPNSAAVGRESRAPDASVGGQRDILQGQPCGSGQG